MDLVGRIFVVPIPLLPFFCFNPSESMDLVGRLSVEEATKRANEVSILLSQWIWLEALLVRSMLKPRTGFNPSESMDLVGRRDR